MSDCSFPVLFVLLRSLPFSHDKHVRKVGLLVGALSPVNRRGLHQGCRKVGKKVVRSVTKKTHTKQRNKTHTNWRKRSCITRRIADVSHSYFLLCQSITTLEFCLKRLKATEGLALNKLVMYYHLSLPFSVPAFKSAIV